MSDYREKRRTRSPLPLDDRERQRSRERRRDDDDQRHSRDHTSNGHHSHPRRDRSRSRSPRRNRSRSRSRSPRRHRSRSRSRSPTDQRHYHNDRHDRRHTHGHQNDRDSRGPRLQRSAPYHRQSSNGRSRHDSSYEDRDPDYERDHRRHVDRRHSDTYDHDRPNAVLGDIFSSNFQRPPSPKRPAPAVQLPAAPPAAVEPVAPVVKVPTPPPQPPRWLGRFSSFKVIRQVGEGAYGVVYKATNIETEQLVAMKQIRRPQQDREGFPVSAIREIKILRQLRHPNIVSMIECVTDCSSKEDFAMGKYETYMVMEYLEHDLAGLLASEILVTIELVRSLMRQLLSALNFCHARKFLHRDIKTCNLLLSNRGELKLADFGLARLFAADSLRPYTPEVITLPYRPPELLLGEVNYKASLDMWSCGCVLGEMLLKRQMFNSRDELSHFQNIIELCGSPAPANWHGVDNLPNYYELCPPSANPRARQLRTYFVTYDTAAVDLLDALLSLNPADRPLADAALKFPFFTEFSSTELIPLELDMDCHDYERKQKRKLEKEKTKAEAAAAAAVASAPVAPSIPAQSLPPPPPPPLPPAGPLSDRYYQQPHDQYQHPSSQQNQHQHQHQHQQQPGFGYAPPNQYGPSVGAYRTHGYPPPPPQPPPAHHHHHHLHPQEYPPISQNHSGPSYSGYAPRPYDQHQRGPPPPPPPLPPHAQQQQQQQQQQHRYGEWSQIPAPGAQWRK